MGTRPFEACKRARQEAFSIPCNPPRSWAGRSTCAACGAYAGGPLGVSRPAKGPLSTERVSAAGMMGRTWGHVEVTYMWCRDVMVF